MIKIEVEGVQTIIRRISAYQDRLNRPEPFFTKCITILSESAKKTFDAQGRPEHWKARKDKNTWPILDKTGRLRDSMEMTTSSGDAVVTVKKASGDAWLDKGTRVPYGQIHQITGVGKAKTKRPFVMFQKVDVQKILEEAQEYFMKIPPREIFTGSRGGRYYINDKGNKIYVSRDR